MSGPFIYVSTMRIKEGEAEAIKASVLETLAAAEEHEPQMIGFHVFFNEDETEMTSIQIHPDPASMEIHLQVLRERLGSVLAEVYEFIELERIDYYGTPNESSLAMDRQIPGVEVGVKPRYIGGFTR